MSIHYGAYSEMSYLDHKATICLYKSNFDTIFNTSHFSIGLGQNNVPHLVPLTVNIEFLESLNYGAISISPIMVNLKQCHTE